MQATGAKTASQAMKESFTLCEEAHSARWQQETPLQSRQRVAAATQDCL